MIRRKYIAVIISVVLCLALVLAGCGKDKKDSGSTQAAAGGKHPSEVWVIKVGGEEICLNEVNFYAYSFTKNMGLEAGNTDLTSYFSPDYPTLEDALKSQLLLQMRQSKILYLKAKEAGIELTADEKKSVEQSVRDFKDSFDSELYAEYGFDDELMKEIFTEQNMIYKLEDSIRSEAEYESVQYGAFYNLVFLTVKLDDSGNIELDDKGEYVRVSKSEQEAQKEKAEEVLLRLQEGEDPEALINEYKLSDTSGLVHASTDSMTDTYHLKDGETSGVLENSFGYSIVQIVKLYDEEYTSKVDSYSSESAVQSALDTQETQWFDSYIFGTGDMNQAVWDAFTFADFL